MSTAPTLQIVKPTSSLSPADKNLLTELEAKVENGIMVFAEALYRIRSHKDGLLWRSQGFGSFEDYCRSRFDFQKQHAYRLAATGEFVSKLDTGTPPPLRESQVRPILNKLEDPDKQVTFWKELVSTEDPKKLTANAIEQRVLEFRKVHVSRKETKRNEKRTENSGKSSTIKNQKLARETCLRCLKEIESVSAALPNKLAIFALVEKLRQLFK